MLRAKHLRRAAKAHAALASGDVVVVPREPTEAMIEAGWIDTEGVTPRDIYMKMIAAHESALLSPQKGEADE